MMVIVVPETCWAYKEYNKIISGILLVFLFLSYHNDARSNKHQGKTAYKVASNHLPLVTLNEQIL
jgi:hypothetical protein